MRISNVYVTSVYVIYIMPVVITGIFTENVCKFDQRCKCSNLSIAVYCDHKNITNDNIPHFPKEVHKLFMRFNKVMIIPPTTFNHLETLIELDLSWNRLSYIEEGTFYGLSSLKTLSIKGNCLNYSLEIPNDIFKPLVSLTHLNVARNMLFYTDREFHTFPSVFLTSLNKLQSIEVDAGHPSLLFRFSNRYLSLTHLTRLKIDFCWLPSVTNLTFLYLPYLEYIEMTNCKIQNYDVGTLPKKKKIRYLDISHNRLNDDNLLTLMQDLLLHDELQVLKMTNSFPLVLDYNPAYLTSQLIETKIEEIYLNNNSFIEIDGDEKNFMLPTTLKVCDFSNNKLGKFYFGMPYLSTLNLRNNSLGAYLSSERYTNSSKTELRKVDISNNLIYDLSYSMFHGHVKTVKINLSKNKLTDVTFDLSHLVSLKELDLSSNNIGGISSQASMDTLHKLSKQLKIDLSNILFNCSCKNLYFLQWMNANVDMFIFKHKYTCRFDNNDVVYLTNVNDIVKQLEKECSSHTTLIICVTIGVNTALVILFAGLMFRFRWKLRYLYYMTRHKYDVFKSIQSSPNYKYDAFISYANEETDFVVNDIIRNLESDDNMKLCVHQRDFIPGEEITQNITNGIHQSKKTICILTRSFLDSYYCMFEFNMARMESIYSRDGQNILFLIFYEQLRPQDLPLVILELVQKQSYIEYPNDEQGNIVFWEKIKESLV
ncbi:toll-like receptor 4 [Mytilus californianus]|uniref:toll-like receptor 4 n=1 Tax=Mytilus californianus TaxID=6549 RepID=UPI00224505E6|nr:toll-like receptor 4 [Mytilus californianus]